MEDEIISIENLVNALLINKGNLEGIYSDGLSPLSLAYRISDKEYFLALLELEYGDSLRLFINDSDRNLLLSMVKDKEWDILNVALDKCDNDNLSEEFIVELSLLLLKENEIEVFKRIISKFFPNNHHLSNGETFITNAIKNNEDDICIGRILISSCFDINGSNELCETALIVACQKLRIELVKILIEWGGDVKYKDNMAVDIVIHAISQCNKDDAAGILKVLMNSRDNRLSENTTESEFDDAVSESVSENEPEVTMSENDLENELDSSILWINDLQTVRSCASKIITEIIKLIVIHRGDITKGDINEDSAISLAYQLSDKRIFTILIENVHEKICLFSNEIGQRLFTKIIFTEDLQFVAKLFNKCEILEHHDEFLLNLVCTILKLDNYKIYRLILMKCFNRNKILCNKETFMTSIIKDNVDESRIVEVVELDLFDLNVSNELMETPLIIACGKLFVDVVGVLLQHGIDVTFQNYKAMEAAIICSIDGSESAINAKNAILNLCGSALRKKNEIKEIISVCETKINFETSDPIPSSVSKYQIIETVLRRSSITSLMEMFIFALFATYDHLDYMFHQDEHDLDNNSKAHVVRAFLSKNIVYPLRRYGSIDDKTIYSFVGLIKRSELLTFVKGKEIDVEEVMKLFSVLFPDDNILKSANSTMHHISLSISTRKSLIGISIQDLLNFYILQQGSFFTEIPVRLILRIPRNQIGLGHFNFIIPFSTIDITNLFINSFKKCYSCDEGASFSCSECIEDYRFTLDFGFFCDSHWCLHEERSSLPSPIVETNSKIQMELQSIICYENDHFVAFVKKDDRNPQWLTFSSLSGPRIPQVSFEPQVSSFLLLPDNKKTSKIFGRIPRQLRQIMYNSYIYIYRNPVISCY